MLEPRDYFYWEKADWTSITNYASLLIDFLVVNSKKLNPWHVN